MLTGIPSVTVDWTLNVGSILQVVFFIGSLIALFYAMKGDIRVIRHDLTNVKQRQETLNEAFTQLGQILTKVAVQDTRLNMIEKSVDEIRHGEGFVFPLTKGRGPESG